MDGKMDWWMEDGQKMDGGWMDERKDGWWMYGWTEDWMIRYVDG
jgi:hypothetical protein